MNATKSRQTPEPNALTTTAQAIGTKLGELAVSIGLAKPEARPSKSGPKKKPVVKAKAARKSVPKSPAKKKAPASKAKARAKKGT